MSERDEHVRAAVWACQAWLRAGREDHDKHAVDAARAAWHLGLDAEGLAETGRVSTEAAAEILAFARRVPSLVVEEVFVRWYAGDRQRALELAAADLRVVSHTGEETVGVDEALRRAAADAARRPAEVAVELETFAERSGTVLVTAAADVRWQPSDDLERVEFAWLCEVADSRLRSVATFLDRNDAYVAAGFGSHEPPPRRGHVPGSWRFLRRALPRTLRLA